jgi:hypothetical protein
MAEARMADDTDFSALYHALGISAACTPEQLRKAYRRRVARLHPDQHGEKGDVARLQELNRMYDAAMEFLRTHGRLPGSSPPAPFAAATARAAEECPTAAVASVASERGPPGPPEAGPERHSRYFILLAVLAITVLALHALETPRSVEGDRIEAVADRATSSIVSSSSTIVLGMGKAQVKAIQGAPLGGHDIRWDYGPSWVDFKCGDVVTDWYSSPLRPLRVASPHPTTQDWDRFDAARPPGC